MTIKQTKRSESVGEGVSFDRIRRITGYLVGTVDRFNNAKRQEERDRLEGQKKRIEWGSQIRSYVLHPYKMVADLRTGLKTADTQGVLDGDLNEFMKRFLMQGGSGAIAEPIEDID